MLYRKSNRIRTGADCIRTFVVWTYTQRANTKDGIERQKDTYFISLNCINIFQSPFSHIETEFQRFVDVVVLRPR